jgi:putative DNA base modification enzyme with NMAD domain
MVHDQGFAPNPFWGYCTLAACTPNHAGVKLEPGDWIIGHGNKEHEHALIYAMNISEKLHFDDYYKDPRFEAKKPRFDKSWREKCGDNIYHLGADGDWIQDPSPFHHTAEQKLQDTKHPYVFVSKSFYYFGARAKPMPERFTGLIHNRQGCSCSYPAEVVREFVDWLQKNPSKGPPEPRDREWVQKLPSGCGRG